MLFYLRSLSDNPLPLPEPKVAPPEPEGQDKQLANGKPGQDANKTDADAGKKDAVHNKSQPADNANSPSSAKQDSQQTPSMQTTGT